MKSQIHDHPSRKKKNKTFQFGFIRKCYSKITFALMAIQNNIIAFYYLVYIFVKLI